MCCVYFGIFTAHMKLCKSSCSDDDKDASTIRVRTVKELPRDMSERSVITLHEWLRIRRVTRCMRVHFHTYWSCCGLQRLSMNCQRGQDTAGLWRCYTCALSKIKMELLWSLECAPYLYSHAQIPSFFHMFCPG